MRRRRRRRCRLLPRLVCERDDFPFARRRRSYLTERCNFLPSPPRLSPVFSLGEDKRAKEVGERREGRNREESECEFKGITTMLTSFYTCGGNELRMAESTREKNCNSPPDRKGKTPTI